MSDGPAPARLSATVLLVRDRAELQVLMVARHYQIDFASGALVFPGGKAHDEDESLVWNGYIDGEFEGVQQAARICAIREAFEESGVLLARPADARGVGASLIGPEVADRLAPLRAAVDRREASFLEMIKDNGLVLALDTLMHFGHWITPAMMPKRFDTHFFLAPAPDEQVASHDGRETTDARWLNPTEALGLAAQEKATIIFPTRMNLEKLKAADTVAAAWNLFSESDVVTVEPRLGKSPEGQACLFIPEEAGYGYTMELLENAMR